MRTFCWMALLALCLVSTGPLLGQDEGGIFPDPVATVNGAPISRDAYYRRLLQLAGRRVLEQLVEEELVRQEAARRKITVTDAELEKRLAGDEAAAMAQRQYSEQRYQTWLKVYREVVRMRALKEKLVKDTVTVTEQEIGEFYDRNSDEYPITVPEGRRVSYILFATDEEDAAHKVRGQLDRNPEKFGDFARQHSIHLTKERGGEYPKYVYLSQSPGADERAIFALEKVGDISPVVTTSEGFFIIRLDDIRPGKKYEYDEVKDKLRELMLQQRIGVAYGEWRKEAMEKAKVEVHFEETPGAEG
ncbi:MAG: peptidyl-prolyl cis-trans isomerase [Armatimonadota bacterium]